MKTLFNRKYEIIIGLPEFEGHPARNIVIRDSIKVAFNADLNDQGGFNTIQMNLYNLNPQNRIDLRHDPSFPEDQKKFRLITLSFKIGYGDDDLTLIYLGTVYRAYTQRQGPDFVTVLEGNDGLTGNRSDFINSTQKRGLSNLDILSKQLSEGLAKGAQSDDAHVNKRPRTLVGAMEQTLEKLRLGSFRWYFSEGKLNQIKDNEVVEPENKSIPVIKESTGMLEMPTRIHDMIQCQSLINPLVKLGQLFDVECQYDPRMDGRYKCTNISFQGDTRSSEWFMVVKGTKRPKKDVVEVSK